MTVFTECSDGFDKLEQFFNARSEEVGSNSAAPVISDIPPELEFAELLTFVTNEIETSSSYIIGAVQEIISTYVGVERELGMANIRKSSLYNDMAADFSDEANFYGQSGKFYLGVIKGNPTNGSQC